MKSSAPWSVKGIKRDARETAKEAARRQGMTVGEWLSQVIYAAGDPETSDGEIEGIRTSDLVTAIEHLNKRAIAAESRGAEAMEDLARTIGAVLERLQRVERTRPPDAADPVGGPAIEERLARLEAKAGDRPRIDALRALEKAVGQVALQYDTAHKSTLTRVESTERQLQELASRLDTSAAAPDWIGGPAALGPLKETIEGLSRRLERAERIAAEAATIKTEAGESVDAEFVERTGARMRILGDEIKRSGDQIRTLESLIRKLSDQIDAAERRSSEGVQKVAETISQLRCEFGQSEPQESGEARDEIEAAMAEVTRRTDTRIAELQHSFESMIARLEPRIESGAAPHEDEVRPVGLPSPKRAAFILSPSKDDFAQAGKTAPTQAEGAGDTAEDEAAPPFDVETDIDAIFDDIDGDEASSESQDDDEAAFTFGPGEQEPEEEEQAGETPTPDDPRAAGRGDEAGLDDGLADPGAGPGLDPGDPGDPGDDPLGALLADRDESAGADSASYLKETRRAVKEAAERAAEGQARRRTLTPKQRALLAAKIRRKRLAEQGLALAPEAPVAPPTPVAAPARPHPDDEERKPKSVFDKATGALTALRARLPGATPETEKPGENETGAAGTSRSAAAAPNLARGARAALARAAPDLIRGKPVAVALGVAILLASAALLFLVKDLLSGAPDPVGGPEHRIEAAPSVPESASQAPAAADEQKQSESPSVPAAPAAPLTQPRALYLESVARLESAKTEAQTREALKLLQQAAALGHPPAQLQLGELYKLGQGVDQDAAQARLWYERAAEGGNVLAMHRAGVMAARGQGGPADQAAAIAWFERAANLGLVDSQYNLGATYHPANDGAPNPAQNAGDAYYWYSLAARNGDEQAKTLAAGLAATLSPGERRAIDERVAEWKAETPDADANEVAAAH